MLALAAVVWLIYDSQNRRLRALGWLTGAIIVALFVVPSLIYRFVSLDTRVSLDPLKEVFFYLGLLGGIIPAVVAAGYFVSFRGMRGCDKGHVYESTLDQCPQCLADRPLPVMPAPMPVAQPRPAAPPPAVSATRRPAPTSRRNASAWLIDLSTKRRYDLLEGHTRVGRNTGANDVVIQDPSISKEHLLIREINGRFEVRDVGSSSGTLVNGQRLRGEALLENGDEITLGDTTLRFVAS